MAHSNCGKRIKLRKDEKSAVNRRIIWGGIFSFVLLQIYRWWENSEARSMFDTVVMKKKLGGSPLSLAGFTP